MAPKIRREFSCADSFSTRKYRQTSRALIMHQVSYRLLSFFSAAKYSASDGSLSKSGLYPFSSYFDRGIGMLPVVLHPSFLATKHPNVHKRFSLLSRSLRPEPGGGAV